MKKSPPIPNAAKILIRVNNWIGDVVMISPALRAVRRAYPEAEITLLAKTWVIDSLQGSPCFDRLIEYDRDGAHAGWRGRWALIRRLREERYDVALLFQKAFEAALFARLARIPRRVGFSTDSRGWLLTDPLIPPREGHHVEQFLRIAEAVGGDTADRRLSFHLTPVARDSAWRFLREEGLWEAPFRIGIHPGASKPPRAWHPARFGEAAAALSRDFGARILLFGSGGDTAALESIRAVAGNSCVLPPQGGSLQFMAALMEHCHLLLCNDSGPMHVAAALRVPVVAMFGPGSPERTGPYTDPLLARVVTRRFPCSPCRQDFFKECHPAPSGKPFCLDEITPADVLSACREILDLPVWAGSAAITEPRAAGFSPLPSAGKGTARSL